jgi:hypothetical protein
MLRFRKYFRHKNFSKIFAFFTRDTAHCAEKVIITLFFKKIAKNVIITLTPGLQQGFYRKVSKKKDEKKKKNRIALAASALRFEWLQLNVYRPVFLLPNQQTFFFSLLSTFFLSTEKIKNRPGLPYSTSLLYADCLRLLCFHCADMYYSINIFFIKARRRKKVACINVPHAVKVRDVTFRSLSRLLSLC